MATATIHRIVVLFDKALTALSLAVPMADVESMAILVNRSLAAPTRSFHNSRHVFQMCEDMKPLQVLAALFHDVVYCQVDKGFPAPAVQLLSGVTDAKDEGLSLRPFEPGDDSVALCAAVFGFSAGQILPLTHGLNEFLSAVVACRLLQRHLSGPQMLAVVVGIAATVPFRARDARGQSAADKLAQRVLSHITSAEAALDANTPQTLAWVKDVITDAVTLANRDVAGFTDADPRQCLTNTWLLLKESNPALQVAGVYGLQELRQALQRTDAFLGQLKPALVCQSYAAYPSAAMGVALALATEQNLRFSRDYLAIELCFIAIIEALALETGGDCPAALFLGDNQSADGDAVGVNDNLPLPALRPGLSAELLDLLDQAHVPGAFNDLSISPLKPWVYRWMGQTGIQQGVQRARQMFDGTLLPQDFLKALDQQMLLAVIGVCRENAPSRRQALLNLASRIQTNHLGQNAVL